MPTAEYKRLMEVYTQSKNINNNSCGDAGYERKTTKVCSRDKPKRPLTAFFLFKRKFKQMHPEMKKTVEIAKAAGEEWRALSDAEKDPYIKEYHRQMKDYVEWKTRSVMPPQLDDTPRQAYATTPGQISRRTGSAEFLQQSNEVARDSAKNEVARDSAKNEVADLKQRIEELLVQNEHLERKLGQQHESDSEVADLKQRIEDLLVQNEELEHKLGQQHESDSEVADLKQTIEELLVQNEDLQLKLKESMLQRLSHLEEELLDLDKKLHEEVVLPCAREEAMSENTQHHRILRSSDSANKRVPIFLLAALPDVVDEMKRKGEDSHPATAAAARQNAGRNRSLQGELRPSKRAASSLMVTAAKSAHSVAGSRVSRQRQWQQLQPAASTRKTRGWVW